MLLLFASGFCIGSVEVQLFTVWLRVQECGFGFHSCARLSVVHGFQALTVVYGYGEIDKIIPWFFHVLHCFVVKACSVSGRH